MKTLILAFAIALVGIIAVFLALSFVGVDKTIAGPIATAIVGAIPYLRESLDKQALPGALRKASPVILSFDGFGMPPQRLILYGALILFATMNLASAFGGMLVGLSGQTMETAGVVAKGVALVIVFPTAFLVGRWVGRRSVSKGIITVFLIAACARVATTLLDLFLTSPGEIVAFIGMSPWKQIIYGVLLLFLCGWLGYWRGRRQRLASYLTYLLGRVSTETREAIVELAFAEASKNPNPTVGVNTQHVSI